MDYAFVCGMMAAIAVWLRFDRSDSRHRLALTFDSKAYGGDALDDVAVSSATMVSLLIAALKQGSSIPRALQMVGESVGGVDGDGLQRVGMALLRGSAWHDAWLAAEPVDMSGPRDAVNRSSVGGDDRNMYAMLEEALESSWHSGVSPVGRLESMLDQCDADERAIIEASAGRLAVKLLLPTGLCFLPAFVLIGVIPSIVSFLE